MDNNGEKDVEQKLLDELEGRTEDKPEDSKPDETKETTAEVTPPTYTLAHLKNADGSLKQLSAEQVVEETNRIYSDNSRISQELSKLKDPKDDKGQSSDGTPTLSKEDQVIFDELKNKFGLLTKDELTAEIAKLKPELVNNSSIGARLQIELKEAINQLEEDYDGSEADVNGAKVAKPKVDGQKVLQYITENPRTTLTPLQIAKTLYIDDFVKYEAKQLTGESTPNLPTTEDTGAGVTEPNAKTKPLGFDDGSAEAAIREMITQ